MIEARTTELADSNEAYGLLLRENWRLKELINLIFASTMPYINGEPTFGEKVVSMAKELCPALDSAIDAAMKETP